MNEPWQWIVLIVLLAMVQYSLIAFAGRDMRQRHLAGKQVGVGWVLVVFGVPFVGPLAYRAVESDGMFAPVSRGIRQLRHYRKVRQFRKLGISPPDDW